jgi:3-oxoacyl-[acyl-carrier-protein] synthase III
MPPARVLDWTDRNTCVLFGDAAGAAVLVPEDRKDRGILDVEMRTDGAQASHLEIPGGGSAHPASHATVEQKLHLVHMNGRQIFTHAVRNMSSASATVLERCGYRASDVTTVFAHQANMRILEGVSQRTGISASVPIALSEALDEGRVNDGDLLLLTALGAGVSWASALVRW